MPNNGLAGIFHEASFDAIITDNTVSNNCTLAAGRSLWYCAEILLNDSRNTKIYGNSVRARSNGIGLVDTDRGTTALGQLAIANDHIHDNTIRLPGTGTVGIVSSSNRNPYRAAARNNFVHNTYSATNPSGRHWEWNGTDDWTEWRQHGQDLTGTVHASS